MAYIPRLRPDQHPGRIAVACGECPVDLPGVRRVGRSAFEVDAPLQVLVGRAAENRDLLQRGVAAAEPHDRVGAVVFMEASREGHRPEQLFRAGSLFRPGGLCEMVVLPRFDVFVAAAGVQVGQRLRPLPAMRGPLPAQCREVYPDEDACRYHEQQQNQ